MTALADSLPRPRPTRTILEGRYARLEPLDLAQHADTLFAASMAPGAVDRFRWLFEAPMERPAFDAWVAKAATSEDPIYHAVVDRATGRAEGRQALMRITPEHGVIGIGAILWGPAIAGLRVATEALYLHAHHVFEDLGYRRFEWKCNALNAPSRRAALRLGFSHEGLFRQHMVVKGEYRDTTWFAMTDGDWPSRRAALERWLAPANFDEAGRQRRRLAECRDF